MMLEEKSNKGFEEPRTNQGSMVNLASSQNLQQQTLHVLGENKSVQKSPRVFSKALEIQLEQDRPQSALVTYKRLKPAIKENFSQNVTKIDQ